MIARIVAGGIGWSFLASIIYVQLWQSLHPTLPLLAVGLLAPLGAIDDSTSCCGRVRPVYSAIMDVPHYWTADQVQRLLDALATHNRHQVRTAALIMWRTGLRVSEVLELEWRDLDYSGDPATLLVRKSKSRRARTVRMHADLVQLFMNWPANRSPRDKVVALAMRTALRHIGDGIEWASLDEESPGTGKRRAGAHSLRHSAARHWLMVGKVPLNVVSQWLGHANVQVTLRIYLPIVGSDYGMENVP